MAGGLPEVSASLPDAPAPNLTQMRAISEPFAVKAHTGKRGRKSDPAHTGGYWSEWQVQPDGSRKKVWIFNDPEKQRQAEDFRRERVSGAMPGKSGQGRKPPKIGGFEWYKQGAGWACRSVSIVDGKRTRRYLGYLSASTWADMQKNHSGPELRAAVRAWIDSKEKG